MADKEFWIKKLDLKPHPEGGYFKESYRSEGSIAASCLPNSFDGERNYATAIYFLLDDQSFSTLHRIQSDETWHFYLGATYQLSIIDPDGNLSQILLGNSEEDAFFQYTVKAGSWFGGKLVKDGFALMGCTVAPGFDFADFELARRDTLLAQYPHLKETIISLTQPVK